MAEIEVSCRINGQRISLRGHSMSRLLDVIRDSAKLTGTKEGCGEGECGACAVLIGGALANSCLIPLAQVEGEEITTVEGIGQGELHPVQRAFLNQGGAQCGICTPGMIMASVFLMNKFPHPSEDQVRFHLAGNLCRCTGFMRIFDSIQKAAEEGKR